MDYGTSDYLNKDRDSIALHKSKYLIPVNKFVKPISADGGKSISFVAFFNQRKRFRFEGWILAKMDEKLLGFSAAMPKIMGISYDKCVTVKSIKELFPQLLKDVKENANLKADLVYNSPSLKIDEKKFMLLSTVAKFQSAMSQSSNFKSIKTDNFLKEPHKTYKLYFG